LLQENNGKLDDVKLVVFERYHFALLTKSNVVDIEMLKNKQNFAEYIFLLT